jgi:hypothetical protein
MSVYRTRTFNRWARKQRLSDAALCDAVHEMRHGLYEADLGGGLLKKRIARPGHGKSGGRAIVATNSGDRWFFVYGFAKNERADIDDEEETALKKLAETLLKMPPASLPKAENAGELTEVICNGEETLKDS